MADNVQYVMDRMAPTLRVLESLAIFTSNEVKQIVTKRTEYEYVLHRRVLTVHDVYLYLQYELNLDKLRIIRTNDASGNDIKMQDKRSVLRGIETVFHKHICSIFDRGTRRFSLEMTLWSDYINFLMEKKSNILLNNIYGKVLALYPRNEDFWLQAALHELSVNNNIHAARVLLQRSLRVNKVSKKLWLKYYEVELWGVAKLTEREKVLGISDSAVELTTSGPAMVVFKHGIKAVADIDFAVQFYFIAQNIAIELANNIEQELLRVHGNDRRLWELMINHNISSKLKIIKKRKYDGCEHDSVLDAVQYTQQALIDAKAVVVNAGASEQQYAELVLCCTHYMVNTLSTYVGSFDAVDTNMKQLSTHVSSLLNLCRSTDTDSRHGTLRTMVEFKVWLLSTALSLTIPTKLLVNYDSFLQFIDTLTLTVEKASTDEASVWCDMISLVMDTTVRLNMMKPKTPYDCSKAVKLLMSKVIVVINHEAGMTLFLRSLDYILARGDSTLVINTLKSLIKHKNCNELTRGHLCYIYMRLNASIASSTVVIEEIKAAIAWIDSTINLTPSLHIHSGLLSFYHQVSGLLMELSTQIRSSDASNKAYYTFTKAFYDKATTLFPKEIELWDCYIDFERLYDNHQVANHLSWKKSTL